MESPQKRARSWSNLKKQVPEDVPGDFFVDSNCIACNAFRQIVIRHFTCSCVRQKTCLTLHTAHRLLEVFGCTA